MHTHTHTHAHVHLQTHVLQQLPYTPTVLHTFSRVAHDKQLWQERASTRWQWGLLHAAPPAAAPHYLYSGATLQSSPPSGGWKKGSRGTGQVQLKARSLRGWAGGHWRHHGCGCDLAWYSTTTNLLFVVIDLVWYCTVQLRAQG